MNLRRAQKLVEVAAEIPQPELLGPAEAQITAVSWGSTRLVLEEVMRQLPPGTLNIIHIPCAWPFPGTSFSQLSQQAKKLVIVEENVTGQLEHVIRQTTGIVFTDHIRRFDGRPFYPDEVRGHITLLAERGGTHA
jgi:2-oxoglutarate ferredoxin oxidoreductase subunit alpha